jgi:hypothetical protein
MAGYSGTPLVQKLGLKPGLAAAVLHPPPGYRGVLGRVPPGLELRRAARGPLDFIQFFTKRRRELATRLPALKRALAPAGALWISWPKQASGVATDLTEDVIRAVALAHGLVDVKVCAVDDTWSGLKLVRRLRDRR